MVNAGERSLPRRECRCAGRPRTCRRSRPPCALRRDARDRRAQRPPRRPGATTPAGGRRRPAAIGLVSPARQDGGAARASARAGAAAARRASVRCLRELEPESIPIPPRRRTRTSRDARRAARGPGPERGFEALDPRGIGGLPQCDVQLGGHAEHEARVAGRARSAGRSSSGAAVAREHDASKRSSTRRPDAHGTRPRAGRGWRSPAQSAVQPGGEHLRERVVASGEACRGRLAGVAPARSQRSRATLRTRGRARRCRCPRVGG